MNFVDMEKYWEPVTHKFFDRRGMIYDRVEYNKKLDVLLQVRVYTRYSERAATDDYPLNSYIRNLLINLAGKHDG